LQGGLIRFFKVLLTPRQANPAEGAVSVIEELRSQDVFDIARPNKTVALVFAVLCDLFDSCVIDRLHEGVAVIEKVSPTACKILNQGVVRAKRSVDSALEFGLVLREH